MTKIKFDEANDQRRHFFRRMQITPRKSILAACAIAILLTVWSVPPWASTAAQNGPLHIRSLLAGPLQIKGIDGESSDDVVAPGERAVLMVTNISNRPINVRMGIRDAASFSTILVTTQQTLQPGEGASLPYIEQESLRRSVIGIVACAEPEHGICGDNSGIGNGGVLASLAVVDDSTNATRFVIGASTFAIAPNS